jgi:hypothetical protein
MRPYYDHAAADWRCPVCGLVTDHCRCPERLALPCARCGARAGERCRNYRGQHKQTCPERGKPAPEPAEEPPSLF